MIEVLEPTDVIRVEHEVITVLLIILLVLKVRLNIRMGISEIKGLVVEFELFKEMIR